MVSDVISRALQARAGIRNDLSVDKLDEQTLRNLRSGIGAYPWNQYKQYEDRVREALAKIQEEYSGKGIVGVQILSDTPSSIPTYDPRNNPQYKAPTPIILVETRSLSDLPPKQELINQISAEAEQLHNASVKWETATEGGDLVYGSLYVAIPLELNTKEQPTTNKGLLQRLLQHLPLRTTPVQTQEQRPPSKALIDISYWHSFSSDGRPWDQSFGFVIGLEDLRSERVRKTLDTLARKLTQYQA